MQLPIKTEALIRRHPVVILLAAVIFLYQCGDKSFREQDFVIGFSQCIDNDQWRQTMLSDMKRELSFHNNIKFIYVQADGDSRKQIEQVKFLLAQQVDLLIISPNEAEPLTPIVEETFKKGIPVIVVDRKISTPLYSAYVGGNNYEIGKIAGEYAAHLLKGEGKVIEITGLPKSSPAIERDRGFTDAISAHPGLTITDRLNGEWLKDTAKSVLRKKIRDGLDADLVFAHNDMMALGTYEILKQAGLTQHPKILGVDGLQGKNWGMHFVADNIITATMLYPTGGEEAIQIALDILNGKSYQKENILATTVIDSSNVRLMQLQNEKILAQQKDIERRQKKIESQVKITQNQTNAIYGISFTLLVTLTLGAITWYSLRAKRKINKKLELQNVEIMDQKDQLVKMSAKAQAANEAKVNFFTNISHEFRTPLTLILGPLEELLANTKNSPTTNQSLLLIRKNVIRLLRLVNQLMDFRKIEVDKMKLSATENDLVAFVNDIVASYKSIALQRNIDLRFFTSERHLNAWFDVNMLDKVIFNLLSNAFKFTKDNGFVYVHVERKEEQAIIRVEDNGIGMTHEALSHAFEVFYQGEFENYKGSGLGLALSKEIVRLHKGTIEVQSEKWKGTQFTLCLPLGKEHLQPGEISVAAENTANLYENEKVYTTDLEQLPALPVALEGVNFSPEYTLLIIEDNEDLRKFLAGRLAEDYEVLQAEDGTTGLQQAFDHVPDLVICDLVMPGKEGMELLKIFKSDVRTSHIPVILLTAKSSMEQQVEGMRNMADAYMTKPFNMQFLKHTIKSLLANRARLKDHFTGDLSTNLKSQSIGKIDRKFITEFTAIVERNISNDNFQVDDICTGMGISRVQLYRKVKALMNVNVNDFILNTRLQKAKYLLKNEELSIGEISYKVGFSSPAYFSTVFKNKFGVSPKAFKEA